MNYPQNKKAGVAMSVAMWIIAIVIAALVVGGGYFFLKMNNQQPALSVSENTAENTDTAVSSTDQSNDQSQLPAVRSILDYYAGQCDKSKLSKVTETGGIYAAVGPLVLDTQEKIANHSEYCASFVVTNYGGYLNSGSVDGNWFQSPTVYTKVDKSYSINVNLKEVTEGGQQLLVGETRSSLPISDGVLITQIKIIKNVNLIQSQISAFIPKGRDPMLDKTIEQIGALYPDRYQTVTYTYEFK